MVLDPNWFYSTLAQCSAAIVGLLGGILVTRLQRQIVEAAEKRRLFEQWRAPLPNILRECTGELSDYEKELDVLIATGEESLRVGGEPATLSIPTHFPSRRGSSVHNNVRASPSILDAQRARRQKAAQVRTLFERILQIRDAKSLRQASEELERLAADAGEDAPAILSDHPARMRAVLETGEQLRNTASITASIVVLSVLTVLCVSGMILPLGFLSARDCSSKYALLGSFSVGLVALLGYIAYQIQELNRLGNTRLDSRGYKSYLR